MKKIDEVGVFGISVLACSGKTNQAAIMMFGLLESCKNNHISKSQILEVNLSLPAYARNFCGLRYNKSVEEVYKKTMQFEELLCALRQDYPKLVFKNGKKFMYRAPRTVVFEQLPAEPPLKSESTQPVPKNIEQKSASQPITVPCDDEKVHSNAPKSAPDVLTSQINPDFEQNYYCLQLLHEVGHAILQHRDYLTDVDRLKMERAAWEQARQLCRHYHIYYDEEFVEAELDTYRDWLHRRSLCKRCGLTCYQLKTGRYRCPRCDDLLGGTE